MRNNDTIKKWSKITAKLIETEYNYKVTIFKFSEDPLQNRVYFLNFLNYLYYYPPHRLIFVSHAREWQ